MIPATSLSRVQKITGYLGLVLASTSPMVFACLPEEFSGQLQGSYVAEVAESFPKLIAVQQYGHDMKVLLNTAEPVWLNFPGGQNSIDYVYLDATNQDTVYELCLYSVYNHSAPGSYQVSEYNIDASTTEPGTDFSVLNTIGAAHIEGGVAAGEQAAALYQALLDKNLALLDDNNDLAFFLRFYSALTYANLRQYDLALADYAVLETSAFQEHPNYYQVLWQKGRLVMRQNRIMEGISLLEQARALAERPLLPNQAALRLDLAGIINLLQEGYTTAKDYVSAQRSFDEALELAGTDYVLLGKIINNNSYILGELSKNPALSSAERNALIMRAVDNFIKASYLSLEAGDLLNYQINQNNLAINYLFLGENRKSLVHFNKVQEILRTIDDPEGSAFFYGNLGKYAQAMGDYTKAHAFIRQALQLSLGTDSRKLPEFHCRYGTLSRILGDTALALSEHRLCLEQARNFEDITMHAEALLQLSIDFATELANDAALNSIQEAQALVLDLADNNLTRNVWTQTAQIYYNTGNYQAAADAILTAKNSKADERIPNDEIAMRLLDIRIERAAGKTDAALATGSQALEYIETLYAALEAERLGPAWSNATDSVYTELADLLMQRYTETRESSYMADAFAIIERSRDISLRQRLASNLPNNSASLEEQNQLRIYSSISSLLADSPDSANLAGLDNTRFFFSTIYCR